MKRICIDASVFMGMNSNDENLRISCKNFFIENRGNEILMNFEQVGICDNIIWSYPFEVQSLYYPFMDLFHTVMLIRRLPYTKNTILELKENKGMNLQEQLNLAFAKEYNTMAYSINPALGEHSELTAIVPISNIESKFENELESFYIDSLKLLIDIKSTFSNVN